jgi:predicted RNA binding protein YcfA (HicA-like mRNA interferase family)
MRLHALESRLARAGWHLQRQRGSHRHYRHEPSGARLTINVHGGVHSTLCWRHLAAIEADVRRLAERGQQEGVAWRAGFPPFPPAQRGNNTGNTGGATRRNE